MSADSRMRIGVLCMAREAAPLRLARTSAMHMSRPVAYSTRLGEMRGIILTSPCDRGDTGCNILQNIPQITSLLLGVGAG